MFYLSHAKLHIKNNMDFFTLCLSVPFNNNNFIFGLSASRLLKYRHSECREASKRHSSHPICHHQSPVVKHPKQTRTL